MKPTAYSPLRRPRCKPWENRTFQYEAIENGGIQNLCRGFQPLEIRLETIPTVCTVGYKHIAIFNGFVSYYANSKNKNNYVFPPFAAIFNARTIALSPKVTLNLLCSSGFARSISILAACSKSLSEGFLPISSFSAIKARQGL